MSEKRFILKKTTAITSNYPQGERVYDTRLERELYYPEIVDCLNEQQEQIEQLHLAIDDLLSHTSCDEIKKENEQLRKVCSHLKKENQSLIETIFDIYEKSKWVCR